MREPAGQVRTKKLGKDGHASSDQRRKPKEMEWTYLIQLKPRKLYGRKEGSIDACSEFKVWKPSSKFSSVKD